MLLDLLRLYMQRVRIWSVPSLIWIFNAILAVSTQQLWGAEANNGLPVLAQAANAIGIHKCYTAVEQVSKRVIENSRSQDVVLDWNHVTPDAAPFFSLTGFDDSNGAAVLSLTTVPDGAGGCSLLAERISSAPVSCPEVASHELNNFKANRLVSGITVYTTPRAPRETITLVEAPPSCVVIRREVDFNWPPAK